MRITACALALFVSTVAHGADVYRSTDANGNVSYSDRRQDAGAELVRIRTQRPSSAPAAPRAAPPAQPSTPAAEPPVVPDGVPIPRSAEERNAERAQNCNIARQRLQAYTASRRLYRQLPDGEREYLSDDQIDEARTRAAADVESWCG